ncbi:hypothetical protein IFM89_011871 [Coptis chinensis]|uniref:TF-B3 domain-containing protein n=1 Tax=Coptis chinensis TaxID=261450 RepID=A0A835I476_9MAGN|nr:hypothetical protein IFM89_011871 [Coptis chinensis]
MDRMLKRRSESPSFFKVMYGDYKNKLLLPRAFVIKNLNEDVPSKLTLTSPSRRSWRVSVKKVDDDFFLCSEWKTFAKDHALQVGEFIVFSYNGNSDFRLKIFGKDFCMKVPLPEKISAESVSNSKKETKGKEREQITIHPGVKHVCPEEIRNLAAAVTEKMACISINTSTTGHEKCEVMEAACSFTVIFEPSTLYRMDVPRWAAIANGLKEKDSIVLLDPCGRSWPVKIIKRDVRIEMGAGWSDFCISNRLNTSDTCRFTLVEGSDNFIRVDILRTSSAGIPIPKQASAAMTMSTYGPKEAMQALTYPRVFESVPSRLVGTQNTVRADIAFPAFTSDYPYCTVTMSRSYVNGKISVYLPAAFARKYLKSSPREVILEVPKRGVWFTQYTVGTQLSQYRLVTGWKDFVQDNDLEVDDVCIFELVDRENIKFKVTIVRNELNLVA